MSTNITSSLVQVDDRHPFNMQDPESGIPLRPAIPIEIARKIISYLPPEAAHRVMTLNKSQMFKERITEQNNLLATRTSLSWTELKKYIRVLALEINKNGFVDFQTSNPKSLTQLAQENKIKLDNLKALDLSDRATLTDDEMREILGLCPNLTSINLSNCQFSRGNSANWYGLGLLGRCPNLTSINLANRAILHEVEIKYVAKGCPKLKSINLSNCRNISDVSLTYLAENCKELALINLESCGQVTIDGLRKLASCPVTFLNLSKLRFTQEMLQELPILFPNLTMIDLSGNQLTDENFARFIRGCQMLTWIKLTECRMTDAGLELLANLPNLNSIELSFSKGITYPGLLALAERFPDFHKKIKKLALEPLKFYEIPTDFTNEHLNQVIRLYPNVTSLNLSECDQITEEGLERLPKMEELLEINLRNFKISNSGLATLTKKCPNLRSINLHGCFRVTDAGLMALAQNCPNLASINLNYCVSVTNNALQALARSCSKLASIYMSYDKEYAYSVNFNLFKRFQSDFPNLKIFGESNRRY